jgi:hypothetical protein
VYSLTDGGPVIGKPEVKGGCSPNFWIAGNASRTQTSQNPILKNAIRPGNGSEDGIAVGQELMYRAAILHS